MATLTEAYEILLQHLPPGRRKWYALESSDKIGGIYRAVAEALLTYGLDVLDVLRRELKPLELVDRIPDWESIFRLAESRLARYGTNADRRAQILARRREWGRPTPDMIRSVVAPLLGYEDPAALEILETSRADLTTLHTYTTAGPVTIGAGLYADRIFVVPDDAYASQMGAQFSLEITIAAIEDVELSLYSPESASTPVRTYAAGSWTRDTGAVVAETYHLACIEAAGEAMWNPPNTWILRVTNNSGGSATLGDCTLFVEGIGRDSAGNDGLGAVIFEWSVLVDPALAGGNGTTPDYDMARAAVERLNPAHCRGFLTFEPTAGGGSCARYDDVTSTYDGCIYCT